MTSAAWSSSTSKNKIYRKSCYQWNGTVHVCGWKWKCAKALAKKTSKIWHVHHLFHYFVCSLRLIVSIKQTHCHWDGKTDFPNESHYNTVQTLTSNDGSKQSTLLREQCNKERQDKQCTNGWAVPKYPEALSHDGLRGQGGCHQPIEWRITMITVMPENPPVFARSLTNMDVDDVCTLPWQRFSLFQSLILNVEGYASFQGKLTDDGAA